MANPGNCAGPAAVSGSMEAQPGLQNSPDRELAHEIRAANEAAADAGRVQTANDQSLLITVLRALSAWPN